MWLRDEEEERQQEMGNCVVTNAVLLLLNHMLLLHNMQNMQKGLKEEVIKRRRNPSCSLQSLGGGREAREGGQQLLRLHVVNIIDCLHVATRPCSLSIDHDTQCTAYKNELNYCESEMKLFHRYRRPSD